MVSRLLVKVTEVFRMRDGTVIVGDDFNYALINPQETVQVSLRRPDGSEIAKEAVIGIRLQQPHVSQGRTLALKATEKVDVPIGTEVWIDSPSDEIN